ncbi:transporter substrate-binding domain-containing protein [Pelomonas sp. SE-A7]|uniref:substrate-binding periplasmic protein n=1 Tax=Pelomonas sp. SE-A7 TaxID=3054953 RepID=UPI00259CBC5A|nr:transporter substrate-binding domain-containing protein [Pelomonas sp. SE-A7]MDM4764643.1 transporter substrate-binding domain-containing protein [Pelomonas sp. SE-A7]
MLRCLLFCLAGMTGGAQAAISICFNQELNDPAAHPVAVELIQAVARRAPELEIRLVPLPWARCLREAALGEHDGALAASHTPERAAGLAFPLQADGQLDDSRRMFALGYWLLRPTGSPLRWDGQQFRGLAEAQQPLGAQRGYSIAEFARQHGAAVDDGSPTAQAMMRKLELGRLSGVLVSQAHAKDLAADPQWAGKLETAGPLLLRKSYFLVYSHGFIAKRGALAERLWSLLAQERESPAFKRLYQHQLGAGQP